MTRARVLALLLALPLVAVVSPQPAQAKRVVQRKPVAPRPPPPPEPEPEPVYDEVLAVDSHAGGEPKGPIVEATATVWALAGSRSWTGCSTVASEAGKQLWSFGEEVNAFRENHHWAIQARECPNAPEVLAMAARSELMRRFDLPEGLDEKTDLSTLEAELAESRDRAVGWIDDAQAELARRRDTRKFGLEYWRGRALLSTGDYVGARKAFLRALEEGAIEGWKLRRLLAITVLYQGDLEQALAYAARSVIDAPNSDKLVSLYVIALVLDRAGDPAGARRRIEFALGRDGDLGQMRALEAALPIHERLYMRAYAKTVRKETAGALRLWAAYLARAEPEAPERRLAERHSAALEPLPTNLGGPPRPGEAPSGG